MTEATPAKKVIEHPVLDPSTGFDNRVHISDAKTGKLIRVQDYARHSRGEEVLYERPIGSGNCYYPNGQPAGRYAFKQEGKEMVWEKISDKHLDVAPAPASREEALEDKNAALEAELAALRAEAEQLKKAKEPKKG